jgi:hypothetical protein
VNGGCEVVDHLGTAQQSTPMYQDGQVGAAIPQRRHGTTIGRGQLDVAGHGVHEPTATVDGITDHEARVSEAGCHRVAQVADRDGPSELSDQFGQCTVGEPGADHIDEDGDRQQHQRGCLDQPKSSVAAVIAQEPSVEAADVVSKNRTHVAEGAQ